MLELITRIVRTLLSGRGLLLLFSVMFSWLIITLLRSNITEVYENLPATQSALVIILALVPAASFTIELLYEIFYRRNSELPNLITLLYSFATIILTYSFISFLGIVSSEIYIIALVLILPLLSVSFYKVLMVLMEVFYRMRRIVIGTDSL